MMQDTVYVLGWIDGDSWHYYGLTEERTGYRALPMWTSEMGAIGYALENLPLHTQPLALDMEQVRVVADMNGAVLLLEDPVNPEEFGRVRFARLGSETEAGMR